MKEKLKKIIINRIPIFSRKEECENEIIARQNEIAKIDMDENIIIKYKGVPDSEINNGSVMLDLVRLARRFDFLGVPNKARIIQTHHCNGLCRKEILNLGIWKINGINSNFRRLTERLGVVEDYELKTLFLCSDDAYTLLYLQRIENNRYQFDITYKKKLHL